MFLKHKVHAIFGGFDKAVQLPSEDEQRESLDLTGQLVLLSWWVPGSVRDPFSKALVGSEWKKKKNTQCDFLPPFARMHI